MASVVDLITQVRNRLPKRFGGTGNDQGHAEGVVMQFNARAAIPLYSPVRVSADDNRVATSTTEDDVQIVGVVIGKYGRLTGDIDPRFIVSAPSNAELAAVMQMGRTPVRVLGSVSRDQYALQSTTAGLAKGSNFGAGAFARFLAGGSNTVSAYVFPTQIGGGSPSGTTYGQLPRPFSRLDVTGEIYSRGDGTTFALEVDPDLLQVDAAQVKVADAGAKYTAPSPASGTETVRPTSDVEASGQAYSSGSVMWSLVDEAVLDTGDYVTIGPGGYAVVGMAASARPQSNEIASVKLYVHVRGGWGGPDPWLIVRDPQLGTRHAVTAGVTTGLQSATMTTRPWDSRPWTLHDVRHLQAGLASNAGGVGTAGINQAYCEVNWTAPKTVETVLAEITTLALSSNSPANIVMGQAAAVGTASTAARSDHVQVLPFATAARFFD